MKEFKPFPGIEMNSGSPRIAGTRLTIYDIFAHSTEGSPAAEIAEWYQLSIEQVQSALAYIKCYTTEIQEDYKKIVDRHAKGNPPELIERLKRSEGAIERIRKLRQQEEEVVQHVHVRHSS